MRWVLPAQFQPTFDALHPGSQLVESGRLPREIAAQAGHMVFNAGDAGLDVAQFLASLAAERRELVAQGLEVRFAVPSVTVQPPQVSAVSTPARALRGKTTMPRSGPVPGFQAGRCR